uniref:Uncharacterized protein n=1 Tax=Cacopsylla melanoneura TaxID=428564 RepID=A0A8D9EK88_9HEMI
MSTSGVTGRGRGGLGRAVEPPPAPGRGRGRGIFDEKDLTAPGLGSLNITNGNLNGYKEDASTALETVTSRPNNKPEVKSVLTKWLDLALTSEDIGEALSTSVCKLMSHAEYGDIIRETVLGRIFEMFKDCQDQKTKSSTTLANQLSFIGYMYLIQRSPDTHTRLDFYVSPVILFMKEILKHRLSEDVVKLLTKQIAINGIALHANADGRAELTNVMITIRQRLLSEDTPSSVRPYLLFLCDLQAGDYRALSESSLVNFYSQHIPRSLLDSFKPLEIDIKLYKK